MKIDVLKIEFKYCSFFSVSPVQKVVRRVEGKKYFENKEFLNNIVMHLKKYIFRIHTS